MGGTARPIRRHAGVTRPTGRGVRPAASCREQHAERRALAFDAGHLQTAAGALDETLHDGRARGRCPRARASRRASRGRTRPRGARGSRRLMPMPVSATSRRSQPSATAPRDRHGAAVAVVLDGVADEVAEHEPQVVRADERGRQVRRRARCHRDAALGRRARAASSTTSSRTGATGTSSGVLALRRLLAARQREQVADELDEVVDALVGARDHRQVGVELVAEALVGRRTSSRPLIEPSGLLSSCTIVRMNLCFSMARRRTSLMSLSVRMRPARLAVLGAEGDDARHVGPLADARAGARCGPWPAPPAARPAAPGRRRRAAPCAGRMSTSSSPSPSSSSIGGLASTTSPSRLTTSTASRSELTSECVCVFSSASASRLASCSARRRSASVARVACGAAASRRRPEVVGRERLGQEEVHALPRRRDRRVDVGVGRDHADHGLAAALLHGLQQAEAVGVGQPVVEQGDVEVARARAAPARRRRRRPRSTS